MRRNSKTQGNTRIAAFTLIELLVTITIIAILAAILFPVFARARENARRANDLSNLKQIGLAYMQYSQDYDGRFPYSSDSGATSWTISTQPYIKNTQLFHDLSDSSAKWNNPAYPGDASGDNYYTTSYKMNNWIAANQPYSFLDEVNSASTFIILADGNTDQGNDDHFHPSAWPPNTPPAWFTSADGWDNTTNETNELALTRHLDTFCALFGDGHVKAERWSQTYWQDASRGVTTGNFDPKQ